MREVQLTKRVEFAAAHRYHNDAWDATRNRLVFGACNNEHGHGHNYLLEVTVAGPVDERNGMVVNLYDLKRVLIEVLEEFDHKHLNLDTPYFHRDIPTGENIAHVLWRILERRPEIGRLERVRLYEDEDLYAEVTAELIRAGRAGRKQASLTRRYPFTAAHRVRSARLSETHNRRLFGPCDGPEAHGHNYVLEVTVCGEVDPETGMVTDIGALDRLVRETVVGPWDRRDVSRLPQFAGTAATGETLARFAWEALEKRVPAGTLERIRLYETQDTYYDVEAPSERRAG
jgi:6-pyruvoyltetrahydropterin/6-carboxytetrahydropterin synthase